MANSDIKTDTTQRPRKPYPTFPLTAHPNGQWCKKIRGQVRFFGVWADPETALTNYNRQAADLHEGRDPRARRVHDVPTIKDLINSYPTSQTAKVETGQITARWLEDCIKILKAFSSYAGKTRRWDDLTPSDFERYRTKLYKKYGMHSIDRHLTIIRSMLKYAYDTEVIDRPIRYGQQFKKPTATEKRKERARRDHRILKSLLTS